MGREGERERERERMCESERRIQREGGRTEVILVIRSHSEALLCGDRSLSDVVSIHTAWKANGAHSF